MRGASSTQGRALRLAAISAVAMASIAALSIAEGSLRRLALAAHAMDEKDPGPWKKITYFKLARAMLALGRAVDRSSLRLWKAKARYPEVGWAERGLGSMEVDAELAKERPSQAITLALIQEGSILGDPRQTDDAARLAKLRAKQIAGHALCSLGAQFVIEKLEGPCPDAAMAFRKELSRLDPGWHRRGLPDDGLSEILARHEGLADQLKRQELVQESMEESEALRGATTNHEHPATAPAAARKRRL